jgi:hypothetical protein
MNNRRKHARKLMFDMLPVSLAGLGDCIGYLVDITPAGLLLRSNCPLDPGRRYGLRIELREPVNGLTELAVEGECVWCRRAPTMNGFNAGIRFAPGSPLTAELVEAISLPPVPADD